MRRATSEGTAGAGRESQDVGEETRPEADEPPATAERFRITDMQHRIDLRA